MKFTRLLLFALLAAPALAGAAGSPAFKPEQLEFFEKKIRPVLAEQCFKCHSATGEKIKGGLVLDSRGAMLQGGDGGPGLIPGDPDKSLIIQAIRYSDDDLQMPPKHRLTPEQIKDFEEWVRMGVPDPRDAPAPVTATVNMDEARKFWSFQPVQPPPVPAVKDSAWARGDIDRFLLAKLEERGLTPNPDADKRALLRRATYDLTGLPPTPDEMREFLGDTSPGAFAKVIDRLLASPAYGERWGRHWLDVVRYADTSGCNSDFPVPSAHRYRNWVINAINADKPYDQFLREQIAGDLLPASGDQDRFDKIIATGYLAIARRFGSQANEFHLTVEDLLDNLGKTTLGLSVGCARCHDHKFDPVLAKDYYALYGIFDSSRFAFPGTEIYPATKDFTPLITDQAQVEKILAEGREASGIDQRIKDLKAEKKKLEREERKAAEDAKKRAELEARRKAEEEKMRKESGTTPDPAVAAAAPPQPPPAPAKPARTSIDVHHELKDAEARKAQLLKNADAYPKAYAVMEGTAKNARLQRKGEPRNLGEEVPRGFFAVLGGQTLPPEEKGSGRRQLAEWITAPANPLTARVMVNRIWQHHFGRGIVKTPNDFGTRGERPTHPELLDYLSARFVAGGWSMKKLHREIMLSRAYRMSSDDRAEASAKDANNDLFWRFNRRRLSAEELRDSVLAFAGTLDRTPGGPHPFKPEREWGYTQHRPFVANYETKKRSVYLMQQRFRKHPFLDLFDGADTNATTAVRATAQTPIQALWFMNNELAHEQSAKLAERLEAMFSDEPARLGYAFELIHGRPATDEEIAQSQQYLRELEAALKETKLPADHHPRTALASLTRILLSSNEFLFVE